ncbi:putative enterotoxin [Ophiocordyceps unilateralis]|uniref:Enterotoxin n=1 Tax=Ophiocordyceps unilateralis TaxID=268505 RepID=A0A2A9P4R2_OPHUN|nr:putative enterotoxin [Ophiocordyceps unilateralis]
MGNSGWTVSAMAFCLLLGPSSIFAAPSTSASRQPIRFDSGIDVGFTTEEDKSLFRRRHGRAPALVHRNESALFRGDARTPEFFKNQGGIFPTQDEPLTNGSYTLDVHHKGHKGVASAYTSTTKLFRTAIYYATNSIMSAPREKRNKDGYIYQIRPTPNMIDLSTAGLVRQKYKTEYEVSALGGIDWKQVEAWILIPGNMAEMYHYNIPEIWDERRFFDFENSHLEWHTNDDYDARYDNFTYNTHPQPQLTGDANSEPYSHKSSEQWAHKFMDEYGSAVGWNGSFVWERS